MTKGDGAVEPSVLKLVEARKRPAVLKLLLAELRSRLPETPVFVFEGPEDKPIYFSWVRRIRNDLAYEPFLCRGKAQVFALRDALLRDLNGLKAGVYYFVDRDFDEMMGNEPDNSIFMTDRYSTENYLVCEEVLEEILKNELHCHGRPDIRQAIISRFTKLYDEFLEVTREVNCRLYVAKQCGGKLARRKPEKLRELANAGINQISPPELTAEETIVYREEPAPEQRDAAIAAFGLLNPRLHYRGKFAFIFFQWWLSQLVNDYSSDRTLFQSLDAQEGARHADISSLGLLASKSPMPIDLEEFIHNVHAPLNNQQQELLQ
ncbi:DUF4435 domain-containing protein [Ferrovibrio sp.]|uniref:DUF4435 domain-containing protein n=1 Tax=Ferrovibrio sp. TaxID=1917215 RepID=UPI0035143BC5